MPGPSRPAFASASTPLRSSSTLSQAKSAAKRGPILATAGDGSIVGRGSEVGEVNTVRKLLDNSRAVDALVVVVTACFVFSAYLDAYAHVKIPGHVIPQAEAAGLAGLTASWFVFTGFLFFLFGRGLRQGRPWNRALPDGYTGSLVSALVFGAALITDGYWAVFTP